MPYRIKGGFVALFISILVFGNRTYNRFLHVQKAGVHTSRIFSPSDALAKLTNAVFTIPIHIVNVATRTKPALNFFNIFIFLHNRKGNLMKLPFL